MLKRLSFILILILGLIFSPEVWAAYPNYTVAPSGQDYTTLNGAFADIIANHATLSSDVTITISGTWASADNTAVTTSGITLNGHTITVSTTGSAKHNGYYQTGGPYLLTQNLNISVPMSITGIQVKNSAGGPITIGNSSGTVTLDRVIAWGVGGSAFFSTSTGTTNIYNSVGTSTDTHCFYQNSGATTNYFNDVAIDYNASSYAFRTDGGTMNVKNSYGYVASGSAYYNNGQTMNLTTTASSDTTGSVGLQSIAYSTSSGAYFTSVTQGSENFTINAGSSLIAAGTNLTGTFTDDIIGATRQASGAWDIGAFYYASAAPSTSTVIVNNARISNAILN